MKNRSVPMVIVLGFVTLFIYQLIWLHQTKTELVEKGYADKLSSPWLALIPFVGPILYILFLWKYAGAAEKATNGKYSHAVAFILLWFIAPVGAGLIQGGYNENTGGGNPFNE